MSDSRNGLPRHVEWLVRHVPVSLKTLRHKVPWAVRMERLWLRSVGIVPGSFVEMPHPLAPGCRLRLDLSAERRYAVGVYEPTVTKLLSEVVRPGYVAYDVGAYIGYFSLFLAKLCGSTGRVFAFEPEPAAFSRLSQNVVASNVQNLVALPTAVADYVGTGFLSDHPSADSRSLRNEVGQKGTAVDVTSLDHLAKSSRIPKPDLMKVDVEGGEALLFRGTVRLLSEARPVVVVEIHGRENGREVCERLRSLEYGLYRLTPCRDAAELRAVVDGGAIAVWPRERARPMGLTR